MGNILERTVVTFGEFDTLGWSHDLAICPID
jgi:hypothetical protein